MTASVKEVGVIKSELPKSVILSVFLMQIHTDLSYIYSYACLHTYTFKININPIQKYYIKAKLSFCFDLILAHYQEVLLLHLIVVAFLADVLLCKLNTALGFYSVFFVVCASFD